MPFQIKNFGPVGGQARSGDAPAVWSYKNADDDINALLVASYFNELATLLQVGDIINASLADEEYGIFKVSLIGLTPNENFVAIDKMVIQPKPVTPHASVLAWSAISQIVGTDDRFLLPGCQNVAAFTSDVEIKFPIPRAATIHNLLVRHGLIGSGLDVPITYELLLDGDSFEPTPFKVVLLSQSVQAINTTDIVEIGEGAVLSVKASHDEITGTSPAAPLNIYVTCSLEAM